MTAVLVGVGLLLTVSLYTLVLLAFLLPRVYENGRVQGRLEQALKAEDEARSRLARRDRSAS